MPPSQAVQDVLLGAGDCGAGDGLARRNGKDDFVVEGVLGVRRVRWGAQSSCWTGVVYTVFLPAGSGIRSSNVSPAIMISASAQTDDTCPF